MREKDRNAFTKLPTISAWHLAVMKRFIIKVNMSASSFYVFWIVK